MVRIKPEKEDTTRFEELFCDLVNADYDVSLDNGEIGLFVENWYLKLSPSGKWRIE